MTREVNLANGRQRKLGQILQWREAVVGRGDEDVVDVKQQAASGASGHAADKVGFAHGRLAERHVC